MLIVALQDDFWELILENMKLSELLWITREITLLKRH